MANIMPISLFVQELYDAYHRKDGYLMGATGQDPRKWSVNSWWFTQYTNAKQHEKALYWREHAARVWDCNGLAEGLYKDFSGVDINTKARYNYAQWCSPRGAGMIPARYRVPGAAVFWGKNAANIHHVAYLYKPVEADNPSGDWYIIEARGVMYGVVKTKLYERKPNFWGWMTKYFDYDQTAESVPDAPATSGRILRNGDEGEDVKEMQTNLIRLGYDLGRWGADGDFGDATEAALKKFQSEHGLTADGEFGPLSREALDKAIADVEQPKDDPRTVKIVGGNCYVRTAPNTSGGILGVAYDGNTLPYQGQTSDNGWYLVDYHGVNAWVSGKYSRLMG